MSHKVLRAVAAGTIVGFGAALVADAIRPRGGAAQLIDWGHVRRLIAARLDGERRLTEADRTELAQRYARLAEDVRADLIGVLGAGPDLRLPPFQAVDRPGWAELNVVVLAAVVEPLLAGGRIRRSHLTELGRRGVDRYLALLLAFLALRVLGQFDPQLLGKEPLAGGSLYLVEPNIEAWAREENLHGDDLRRWLILHESTHAWQFSAHPWLRDHLNSALESVLAVANNQRTALVRMIALSIGLPSQWAALRRMQGTMSLVEGYSNLVMNLAGRRSLPGYDRLEAAYRRRSRRGGLEIVVWKLSGLDLKLKQYVVGEAFCQTIYDQYGMSVLNQAWESAEKLPTEKELTNPTSWYQRITATQ